MQTSSENAHFCVHLTFGATCIAPNVTRIWKCTLSRIICESKAQVCLYPTGQLLLTLRDNIIIAEMPSITLLELIITLFPNIGISCITLHQELNIFKQNSLLVRF